MRLGMLKIKVLLVEDEPLMLRTMKRIIQWDKYNMEIVGEACNGKKALEWLAIQHTDIVITDVGMPLMGGIELIQEINRRYPDVCTAVISGYNDYDKVKNAFVSGAMDYILKSDMDTTNMDIFLKKIKRKVLDQRDHDFDIKEYANAYDVLVEEKAIRMIIARSLEYEQPHMTYLKNTVMIDTYKPIYRRGEILYIIPERDSLFILRRLVKELRGKGVIVGVSDIGTLDDSKELYQQATHAMTASFYIKDRQVFLYQQNVNEWDSQSVEKVIQKICQDFRMKHDETIEKNMDELGAVFEMNHLPVEQVYEFLQNIMREILFIHKEVTGQKSIYTHEVNSRNIQQSSWMALKDWVLTMIKKILLEREDITENITLKNIEVYLKTHFRKNISIKQISKKFAVSESYISHKFKEIYGISFKVYLNQVRIEHAKKLLKQKQYKQTQICDEIGFSSSEHFSRIFKKYVGVSPRTYKNMLD